MEVHTGSEIIVCYERLGSVFKKLPTDFYQCHKSFVVNMTKIRRFRTKDVLLKNGEAIPVSRARYAESKEAYFN